MKDLEIMLSLIGTVIGLLITVLTFVVKTINNTKAKKIAEAAVKIGNAILPFIHEAEKITTYSGEEKKTYVMTKASQFAAENHISFDAEQVSEKIEELVTLTKQVNIKTKIKENAEVKKGTQELLTKQTWL